MMSLFLLSIPVLAYFAGIGLFAVALRRPIRRAPAGDSPSVTIVVAARDEEQSIAACLDSLSRLDYPSDRLRIVVVDDHSSDRTAEIVEDFAGRFPAITLIEADEPEGDLRGKVNALVNGIDAADGEIIMLTDADCVVPPGWVRETVRYYSSPDIDLVAGFIGVSSRSGFEAIQAIDWIFLLSAASAGARLSFPVTAVGNNLSFRRSAYDAVGGYRKIPFNVTEDLALFRAITGRKGRRAVIPIDPETAVTTAPCPDWRSLFRQRKRWFVGGRMMAPGRGLALALAALMHLLVLSGWLYISAGVWVSLAALKCAADAFMIWPALKALRVAGLLKYWLPFQMYLSAYIVLLPLIAMLRPAVRWKGRDFAAPASVKEKSPPA